MHGMKAMQANVTEMRNMATGMLHAGSSRRGKRRLAKTPSAEDVNEDNDNGAANPKHRRNNDFTVYTICLVYISFTDIETGCCPPTSAATPQDQLLE